MREQKRVHDLLLGSMVHLLIFAHDGCKQDIWNLKETCFLCLTDIFIQRNGAPVVRRHAFKLIRDRKY